MKYLFAILVCVVLFPHLVVGQQCQPLNERPAWADGFFRDLQNSYLEVATATGSTEMEARNNAAQIIMARRAGGAGQRVQVIGGVFSPIDGSLEIRARVIDEFRERCGHHYRVSLLVETAKNPMFPFHNITLSDRYPFSARVFVPGMAQFYKGSRGKGIMFISAQAVTIGGVIVTESLRATNASRIGTTHDVARRQQYIDNANMFETARNVAIAGAAVVYVWNVIDGIAARGKRHVRVNDHAHLNIVPMASPSGGGVLFALNF